MMNMMYGFGGWWLLGLGLMVLFRIAIILLVIWVVRSPQPVPAPGALWTGPGAGDTAAALCRG